MISFACHMTNIPSSWTRWYAPHMEKSKWPGPN